MSLPPFETVVREHGPAVLRVCRASLSRHDADDAWSAAFLSALRAYPSLDADANIEAWLVTIAHRKVIDLVRARQRAPVPTDQPTDQPPESADQSRADEPSHALSDDGLWGAVRALPDKQRTCVAYRYITDLSYREIAEIVGGSEAAARRAAADGIRTLRSTYGKGNDHV